MACWSAMHQTECSPPIVRKMSVFKRTEIRTVSGAVRRACVILIQSPAITHRLFCCRVRDCREGQAGVLPALEV